MSITTGGCAAWWKTMNGSGPGSGKPRPGAGARGLELVHRRLAIRYAGAAVFRLEASDGRTRSIVELPAEPP